MIIGAIILKTFVFTLLHNMFILLLINGHDYVNERSAEINFHSTQSKKKREREREKIKGFLKCAVSKVMLPPGGHLVCLCCHCSPMQ
jgi:hypothetical protein